MEPNLCLSCCSHTGCVAKTGIQAIEPAIAVHLEGDARKIRQSIVIGSVIPLMMFLAWNAVILGSVSSDMVQGVSDGRTVFDPLEILRAGGAGEWLGVLVSVFSEFAIVTSFIGFVYGLLDFFKGTSNVARNEPSLRLPLYSLILFPPMSLSALNPSIFFTFNREKAGTITASDSKTFSAGMRITREAEPHRVFAHESRKRYCATQFFSK